MSDKERQAQERWNELNRKKIELEDEIVMKNKRIDGLEKDLQEARKRLEDEIARQKMSADKVVEELKKKIGEIEEEKKVLKGQIEKLEGDKSGIQRLLSDAKS